jgi:hypothetical protein
MSVSQFRTRWIAGFAVCGVLAFLLGQFTGVEPGWHSVRDGMTEAQVLHLLGTPSGTGNGSCIGAGGKPITRWEYRSYLLGRSIDYYVDFDYVGPGGIPLVFRTEHVKKKWTLP